MKLLYIVLFSVTLLVSLSKQDELQGVEAAYDGQAGGVFYFVDMEGDSYAFDEMEPKAQEKYDLTDGSCEGKRFVVVYRIEYKTMEDKEEEEYEEEGEGEDEEEEEEKEDDYGTCIIVDLELIG